MKRAMAISALLALGAGCEAKKAPEPLFVYNDAGPRVNPQEPDQRVDPSPMTDACQAACAQLEGAGPLVELQAPFEESGGDSSVTFGKGQWYVAWGGRPSLVTQIQRFAADGQPVGMTRRLERTTPEQLVWNPQGEGELDLFAGAWPGSDGQRPDAAWLRFDANVVPLAGAFRILEARTMRYGYDQLEILGSRLERTNLLDRIQPMVRLHRFDPAGGAAQTVEQHDWYTPSNKRGMAVEHIGDKRFVIYSADGAVQVAELPAKGPMGAPRRILEGFSDTEMASLGVRSTKVGNDWWIGAFVNASNPAVYGRVIVRKVDPRTLTGQDEPIRITWPTGYASDLIDANGTLAVGGNLEPTSSRSRWSFVPIDVAARAVCHPSTVTVSSEAGASQTVRAMHFEGDTAGVTLDTWAGSGPRHMFFTRLACTRRAP